MTERLLEWLGNILNNQTIGRVDYDDPDQKEAIVLLRECNIIDRSEGGIFVLHPHLKERFAREGKILSIHEKLSIVKSELGPSRFSASPAASRLLQIITPL